MFYSLKLAFLTTIPGLNYPTSYIIFIAVFQLLSVETSGRINIYLDIEKIEQDLEEFKDISGLEERENEKKEVLSEYI